MLLKNIDELPTPSGKFEQRVHEELKKLPIINWPNGEPMQFLAMVGKLYCHLRANQETLKEVKEKMEHIYNSDQNKAERLLSEALGRL